MKLTLLELQENNAQTQKIEIKKSLKKKVRI